MEVEVWIDHLTGAGIRAVREALVEVDDFVKRDPEGAFEVVRIGERQKKALAVDKSAERIFTKQLHRYRKKMFSRIVVHGEESLRNEALDLSSSDHADPIFALVDAVDGTDLLERGLGNWCSAAVFFRPEEEPGKRILGAFVGLPSGEIYYSTLNHRKQILVQAANRHDVRETGGLSANTSLMDASICFYGQKANSFRAIFSKKDQEECLIRKVLTSDLDQKRKRDEKKQKRLAPDSDDEPSHFRIYNLAGIPMVMKLIDHKVRAARNIDVVFDVRGQKPHDVIPGAYLALKADATVRQFFVTRDLMRGEDVVAVRDLDLGILEEILLKPSSPSSNLMYVIAATKELANDIEPWLVHLIKQQLEDAEQDRQKA